MEIKTKQENNPNFLRISKREEDFALDVMDEIKKAAQELGKGLTQIKHQEEEEKPMRKPETRQAERNEPRNKEETGRKEETRRPREDREDDRRREERDERPAR
jgi:hypothetical protein